MAKMYYNAEEALAKLGCTEDELKGLVREGKLREFRDSGKLNYRVEEVDNLAQGGGEPSLEGSGELTLEDSTEIPLAPMEEGGQKPSEGSGAGKVPELGDSDEQPVDLSTGSGTGLLSLEGESGEFRLEDSGGGTDALSLADSGGGSADLSLTDSGGGSGEISLSDSGSGSGDLSLADSGGGTAGLNLEDEGTPPPSPSPDDSGTRSGSGSGADIVSLDEVDKDAVEGMKKDDTVITNIGISVFDDDDLEIAADPMAKTMMTGGDEHLGLDGSGGGSGLLDLTRESDDTSLGAELLEGIDMGDTAETEAPAVAEAPGPATEEGGEEVEEALPEAAEMPAMTPGVPVMVGSVEAASPAFAGLLAVGAIVLMLAGAVNIAMSLGAWPSYLGVLADQFWIVLAGSLVAGGLFALVGWLVGRQATAPRRPKPAGGKKAKQAKPKKAKAKKSRKKGKKGEPEAEDLEQKG